MISRRAALSGACAAMTCAVAGRSAAATRGERGLIDVHHHIRPPGAPEGFARLTAKWSVEGALAEMDGAGVAAGMAYPGPILGSVADKKGLARQFNDFGAGLTRRHPSRFGLFASLPLPDIDATLAEIAYARDALHADGFGISTSYGDAWLGDARFWPVYASLNAIDAVLFVHPHDAACCAPANLTYLKPGMDGSWIDWPMNTARTIFSLITSGTLRQFPRIRWIFAHGGGVMPLLIERLAGFGAWDAVGAAKMREIYPDGVAAEFRKLHFEGAQAWAEPNLGALRTLVPDSQILFGSDYPFFSLDYAARGFAAARLPSRTRAVIGRDNAARLMPRWA